MPHSPRLRRGCRMSDLVSILAVVISLASLAATYHMYRKDGTR